MKEEKGVVIRFVVKKVDSEDPKPVAVLLFIKPEMWKTRRQEGGNDENTPERYFNVCGYGHNG